MLDSDTKRRIDTCRDILVGKVPDPKSQVEQITIALIYKFMDDMDAEAETLGGSRSFFTGDYAKYGWSKLMAPNMGGFDVLSLYSEAIQKMNENPGVPALFRDIFKNAYLPYRDPETLRSFLKEIHGFTYDHSERLGDAFEYLLSVLGSQGEAGQFRTPRHIIDFMVEIIDPKKDETILDPACGTAGFLISSYKHILKHNTSKKTSSPASGKGADVPPLPPGEGGGEGVEAFDEKDVPIEALTLDSPLHYKGDLLTPDDRKRLAANIHGYDISPDMVRLSLVNMYLHGFTDPHIDEYDTLTSDEKWNALADVILANPPFMSPKGGIKPHKRFSVEAKRSEVLFADYIAEHLTPNGRAAMVVPEGIIFQSGTAYKQLREMLVKNYLVAVISLPAGVFNPYSGVKTSILVMDKRLAKKTDEILFAKIDNDGYNLGAQRRPIDRNDLPAAARNIKAWLESVRNGAAFDVGQIPNLNLVAREKIGENGEWNLSGDRYQDRVAANHKFELIELGALCKPEYGFTASAEDSGNARFIRITDIDPDGKLRKEGQKYVALTSESERYLLRKGDLLVARTGATYGKTMFFSEDYPAVFASYLIRLRFSESTLVPAYYWAFAQTAKYWEQAQKLVSGGAQPQLNGNALVKVKIPLPPLEVQKEIVAEIEGYQKIIDGARQVVGNYQPRIPIHPDWPMVPIEELVADEKNSLKAGPFGSALRKEFYVSSGYKIYGQEQVIRGDANYGDYYINEEKYRELESCKVKAGDVLISLVGTYGKTLIVPADHEPGIINPRLLKVTLDPRKMLSMFFVTAFAQESIMSQVHALSYGGTMDILSLKVLKNLRLPLPSLDTQRAIVAQIEEEQRLVNANKELIRLFEDKIKATINRVWGEAEPPLSKE